MDIAHILKNKSVNNVEIKIELSYDENGKAHVTMQQDGYLNYVTKEVHDDEDLMAVLNNYICNTVLLVPINLLNTGNCCYGKDISKLQLNKIKGQIDYCANCTRYYQCDKVAELNDRLAELDESEGK